MDPRVIGTLAKNPRSPSVKALQGDTSMLRLRVGEYRIIYTVIDRELLVLVIAIGHRLEVYR
jgi:mRNA interferase RelE/StbE